MIKNVEVVSWCISCKNCENVCPSIFQVAPKSKVISKDFNQDAIKILQAAIMCPVQVIKVDTSNNYKLQQSSALLQKKKFLSKNILELTFQVENFSFHPWQYISLEMQDVNGTFFRSYSIVSANKNHFILTIKLLNWGRWSHFLKKLRVKPIIFFKKETKLNFFWPHGDFYLRNTPNEKVFIATGTGLAPMISMLENTPAHIHKTVIFGWRFEEDLYYLEKLYSFSNTQVITCVSQPTKNYIGNTGRVTNYLNNINKNSEIYICWNPDMIQNVKLILIQKWHKKEDIFEEWFVGYHKKQTLFHNFFLAWNIPFIKQISLWIILFSLLWIPLLYYNQYQWINYFLTSWIAVCFVMYIRPLSNIFPQVWILSTLNTLRKSIGILSSSIILTIFFIWWIKNPFLISNYFSYNSWNDFYSILSRISEISALLLLLTSNSFSQKKLGIWWKRIQRLSYLYFITWWLVAAQWWLKEMYYSTIIIWIILYVVALMKNIKNNKSLMK